VIDQHVAARHLGLELDDGRAAGGISVVCTFFCASDRPSKRTLSKMAPMTWKLDTRLGPPLPTNRRTVSFLAVIAGRR
jgi:hypothetical protein